MQIRSMERGMALVAALLLLLVLTMLAVGMFRSFGLQEHIAGNTRERQRAVHAALAAQSFAEWWLRSNNGANAQQGTDCSQITLGTSPQICTNALSTPATLPWGNFVSYTPNGMSVVSTAGTIDAYANPTGYYIAWVSGTFDSVSNTVLNNYLVDANGYAGSTSTAAVVESSFSVRVTYTAQTDGTRWTPNDRP
jgi:type IV pilus assembly protein PilX